MDIRRKTMLSRLLLVISLFSFPVFSQQDIVAHAFGQDIYVKTLAPSENELKAMSAQGLTSDPAFVLNYQVNKLTEILLDSAKTHYAQTKGISLNNSLVDKFLTTFDASLSRKTTEEKLQLAQKQVMLWQIDKALYEEFGGDVSFQQSHPQLPIGAYQQVLENYFASGDIVIQHSTLQNKFWASIRKKPSIVIEENKIDFSKPWWATL